MAEEQLAVRQIQDQIIRLGGRPPAMLVKNLAEIYQVDPKQIVRAVSRNPDRFPEDFVFRLTAEEWGKCSRQNDPSAPVKVFAPHNAPLAFTREGANQLSSCLRSKVAAERSIQIMRAFSAIEEQIQQFQGSGDMLLDSIRAMAQLRERQIETQKALAAQAQTLATHDQALADQGRKLRAIAASQEEALPLTPEQEKTLMNLTERLITARSAVKKISAGEAAKALYPWIKARLGIRTYKTVSQAQYPMARELLETQIQREEAALGQGTLKIVKARALKPKGPWSDI